MAVEGTLDLFRLPEILQLISQQNKTGILTVQGQQDIVAVSFLNGRIVAADALTQTVEEGLSQVLVSEELVSAADFYRVAAENQAAGGRLLDALVEHGLVTRAKLLDALRVQTRHQLQRLLRWDQGDFKFYSGDEVSYEDGFMPISVEELLLDSLQDFADRPLRPALPAPPSPAPPANASPVSRHPGPSAAGPDFPEVPLPVTKVFPAPPASQVFALEAPANRPAAARREGARPLRVVPARPSRQTPSNPVAAGLAGPQPRAVPTEPPLTPPAHEPPLPKKFRKMELARPKEKLPAIDLAVAPLLAALLAGCVIATLVLKPAFLTSPFPWQGTERAALLQEQQQALYAKIGRGARTFFLLEGRFPDRLQQLADMGLLSPADFEDSQRHPLQYEVREESYILRPLAGGRPVVELETAESVSGNFLLDPQLLVPAPSTAAPIVLLD